jgi:hypothetical protein
MSASGSYDVSMMRLLLNALRLLGCAILTGAALAALEGCQTGNTGSPGDTPNMPQQTSYRIVGDVGTPFQATISDSRSSWQLSGTVPTSIAIVNDDPPDRIAVTKTSNDGRLLSLQLIQGLNDAAMASTVSNFGTAVGNVGGTLANFANPASPDVRFFVKTPLVGVVQATVEDETTSFTLESPIASVILFDFPNGGKPGRVDGIFSQPNFTGALEVDLLINGQLVQTASGASVTVHGD